MKDGYIIRIEAGLFVDRVISTATTVEGALADGLAYFRAVARHPNDRPKITAEPTQIVPRHRKNKA